MYISNERKQLEEEFDDIVTREKKIKSFGEDIINLKKAGDPSRISWELKKR